ncbi:MAG: ACT domain-containing protein, partial [Angustibacter sp.]
TGQPVPTPAPLTERESQLLELVRRGQDPQVDISYVDEMHVLTVVAVDRLGLFGDIAGLLAAEGLSVRSALVRTVPGGPTGAIAVDGWWVTSPYGDLPSPAALVTSLRRLAAGDRSMLDRLARRDAAFRPPQATPAQPRAMLVPGASETSSVVEVRASDRPGLLHALGRTLGELRVDIRSAHVATHAGQAVDTLYLSEPGGGPLDPARTAGVIAALVDAGATVASG